MAHLGTRVFLLDRIQKVLLDELRCSRQPRALRRANWRVGMTATQKEKDPTRVGPRWINYSCEQPDPTTPGGWAEANPWARGPATHDSLPQITKASLGQIGLYISLTIS